MKPRKPNPNYRSARNGEACGGGFDHKGVFKLIHRKGKGLVRVYADGSEEIDWPEHGSIETIHIGRLPADYRPETKPSRFRFTDGKLTRID